MCLKYLSERDAGRSLSYIYQICDYINIDTNISRKKLICLFNTINKQYLMTSIEYEKYKEMLHRPELTIYRGSNNLTNHPQICGLSWTLDKDVAIWFAKRFAKDLTESTIVYTTISSNTNNILAYYSNEDEVVVDFRTLNRSEIIAEVV